MNKLYTYVIEGTTKKERMLYFSIFALVVGYLSFALLCYALSPDSKQRLLQEISVNRIKMLNVQTQATDNLQTISKIEQLLNSFSEREGLKGDAALFYLDRYSQQEQSVLHSSALKEPELSQEELVRLKMGEDLIRSGNQNKASLDKVLRLLESQWTTTASASQSQDTKQATVQ